MFSNREYLKILAGDVDPELGPDDVDEKKVDVVIASDTNGNDESITEGLERAGYETQNSLLNYFFHLKLSIFYWRWKKAM